MTVRERNIQLPMAEIEAFCRRHPIKKLSLFGSVLRDDFGNGSDVDVLVELIPTARVGLFKFMDMQFELEKIIGHTVDLRTIENFPERLREHVASTAECLYVR